jgi:hypothetical protein
VVHATSAASFDASATLVSNEHEHEPDAAAARLWQDDCSDGSPPRAGKSVGHTSVAFKLELANGKKVAWKPNAKRVKGRYKGEIAAYRMAKALEVPNVLPACVRAFEHADATAALAASTEAAKLFADEAIVEGGKIYGAIIPWVDGLQFWPVERDPLRTEARTWLAAGSEIPKANVDLARQTSTLIAFDFLTGNWDRYSGENVGIDKTRGLVLYLDNDAAFMESPPKEGVARNKALLDATDRFSRRFIANVRALDEARLALAFGEEAPGRPLLSPVILRRVARRVKELIALVDAKIALRGERETLYFP